MFFALFPSTTALLNILDKLEVQREDLARVSPLARRSNLRTPSSPPTSARSTGYSRLPSTILRGRHHNSPQLGFPGCRCSHLVIGKTAFKHRGYYERTHGCPVRPSSHT
ncbi:hypothetical protein FRC08_011443 [Ceratobasidium sp. 394]|nr:hypothetical protein FRC08_011443 [Ceratobasidium sp. 394]